MKTYDIINVIKAQKARSAWARGVKQIAVDMLDGIDKTEILTAADVLNGADSPEQWAYGGCGLIYDEDIAELLCTPSELRRTKGGQRQPNSCESWLDVYARAAVQAYKLIKAISRAKHTTRSNCSDFERREQNDNRRQSKSNT